MYKGKLEKLAEIENNESQNNISICDIFEGTFYKLPEKGE